MVSPKKNKSHTLSLTIFLIIYTWWLSNQKAHFIDKQPHMCVQHTSCAQAKLFASFHMVCSVHACTHLSTVVYAQENMQCIKLSCMYLSHIMETSTWLQLLLSLIKFDGYNTLCFFSEDCSLWFGGGVRGYKEEIILVCVVCLCCKEREREREGRRDWEREWERKTDIMTLKREYVCVWYFREKERGREWGGVRYAWT